MKSYTPINGSNVNDSHRFFTLAELIDLCETHEDKFFYFVDTEYTVGDLQSWRGSYELPCVDYVKVKKTGSEIARSLNNLIEIPHSGYKGGEYTFNEDQEFYVSSYGNCDQYKIFDFEVKGNEVILYTEVDPY